MAGAMNIVIDGYEDVVRIKQKWQLEMFFLTEGLI